MMKHGLWVVFMALVFIEVVAFAQEDVEDIDHCNTVLMGLTPCLPYIVKGSTLTKPGDHCCNGFRNVVKRNPNCLCQAFSSKRSIPVLLDLPKTSHLPRLCEAPTAQLSCQTFLSFEHGSSSVEHSSPGHYHHRSHDGHHNHEHRNYAYAPSPSDSHPFPPAPSPYDSFPQSPAPSPYDLYPHAPAPSPRDWFPYAPAPHDSFPYPPSPTQSPPLEKRSDVPPNSAPSSAAIAVISHIPLAVIVLVAMAFAF